MTASPSQEFFDEISVFSLVTAVWSEKWLALIVSSIVTLGSIFFAAKQPDIYVADALLAPADASSSIGNSLGTYSGLAALAGMPLPSGAGGGSNSQLGMQLMQSRAFLGEFAERRNIFPEILAVESWDETTRVLSFDPNIYDEQSGVWFQGSTEASAPSQLDVYMVLSEALTVMRDAQTGYVTITMAHESPLFAARLLTWIIEDVNVEVKRREVEEATESIKYLQQQIEKTALADMQNMFFELIQSQTEVIMLAEVRPEYVFTTIDPPVVPKIKSSPNRENIAILGGFLGIVLGCLISFSWYTFKLFKLSAD
jgi:uncharacterized protein involved in exopolysaccharide biosynthesis